VKLTGPGPAQLLAHAQNRPQYGMGGACHVTLMQVQTRKFKFVRKFKLAFFLHTFSASPPSCPLSWQFCPQAPTSVGTFPRRWQYWTQVMTWTFPYCLPVFK